MASTRRIDSPTRPCSSLRSGALIGALSAEFRSTPRAFRAPGGGTLDSGWWFGVAPFGSGARRHTHGVEDLRVPRAPAEVAAQRLADLVVGRIRRLPQEIDRSDHQAGRAEAA